MPIRIELFGIPRHRTGVPSFEVEAQTLGCALTEAGRRWPVLAESCLDGERLRGGFLANVNGRIFVSDPATPLASGDCVLIVSSDVGG
jgi:molybdopterin converting factor small subunit